jgi:SAM-dependent methyltransferase
MAAAAAPRIAPPYVDGALLGEVVARAAACPREDVARDAIELLSIAPADAVLELGCGSGRMLAQVAARLRRGTIVGIDPSELMVRHARFRNRRLLERGRAEIRVGHSGELAGFADASFDKVFGVHVIYFWGRSRRHLAEIRRVLRPGGRLALGFWPGQGMARCPLERAEAMLHAAGFAAVRSEMRSECGRPHAWVVASR